MTAGVSVQARKLDPYTAALSYLYSFADYEKALPDSTTPPFTLERPRRLLELLGNPQNYYPTVLVGGTKGKGSTCAMLESILRAGGYATGMYTQPHLHTFRERIRANGLFISPEDLAEGVEEVGPAIEKLHCRYPELGPVTTYEAATAVALHYFARKGVEIAVLEVGMGGRLDATNVAKARVSVLTPISLDHTQILGDTIRLIACEKADIIKQGAICVSAPQPPAARRVITGVCLKRGARLLKVGLDGVRLRGRRLVGAQGPYPFIELPLLGRHQWTNAATALTALEALASVGFPVGPGEVALGLESVQWPGRLEILGERPLVVADGAHNPASARALARALRECFPGRPTTLVLGIGVDKDIPGILGELRPVAQSVVATKSRHPRAAPVEMVAGAARPLGIPTRSAASVVEALAAALSVGGEEGMVCVAGSLFVVAEARESFGLATEVDPST